MAVLIFLEAALRINDYVRGYGFFNTRLNLLAKPLVSKKIIPFRIFGFDPYATVGGETLISDRWGNKFSLEKPDGVYRIVCFGGSTTQNRVGGDHYPGLLQEKLRRLTKSENVEVINLGFAAYATPHSIILLEFDVISWQPDLVILSHNVNDLFVLYWPAFRPDYWNKYGHEFYTRPDYTKIYSWANVTFQHSHLYWFLYHRWNRIRMEEESRSKGIRRQSYDESHFRRAAIVFKRNLKTFIDIAKSNDIGIMLGTQPLEASEDYFLKHMAYKPYNDIIVYPPHDEFVEHHAAFNNVLREVSMEEEVDLVDNERKFDGKTGYFSDFVHYSELGVRELANNYAVGIIENYFRNVEHGGE